MKRFLELVHLLNTGELRELPEDVKDDVDVNTVGAIAARVMALKAGAIIDHVTETWNTKDGRDMDITEMAVPHLFNTIKLIERCAYEQAFYDKSVEAEEKLAYVSDLRDNVLFRRYLGLLCEVVRRELTAEFNKSCPPYERWTTT